MLLNISNGALQSLFVLLIDDVKNKGEPLLNSLICSWSKQQSKQIHVFCCNRNTALHIKTSLANKSNVHSHDFYSNTRGWLNNKGVVISKGALRSCLTKSPDPSSKEMIVVVDSLSIPIFHNGIGACIEEIKELLSKPVKDGLWVRQVLCLVHKDVLPGGVSSLAFLRHAATTCMELKDGVVHTVHRKPGGHVDRKVPFLLREALTDLFWRDCTGCVLSVTQNERYTILPDGKLSIENICTQNNAAPVQDRQVPLPQDVVSTRIGLNDSELELKKHRILPYLQISQQEKEKKGGKVFYQPDAADDWDEEDPDDDLDV